MARVPSEIHLEVGSGVAVVTLDAPERRNALDPAMADALVAAFEEVDARSEVGALVVRGEGAAFCAGATASTIAGLGADPAGEEAYGTVGKIYGSFARLGRVRVPTVAAVRGSAVGAGMNLLLAADLRVVGRRARLISGFLKRGMHPGGGHFLLLQRLAGREAAAAMALFGEEIDGERAAELGLAWEAVDDAAVDDRARELAARLAADPELSRAAVASFRAEAATAVDWDVALQLERSSQMWSMRRAVR